MDIIMIGLVIFAGMIIVIGFLMYFILKEDHNVRISKKILYFFKQKCEDDFDELIKFKKSHKSHNNYKI